MEKLQLQSTCFESIKTLCTNYKKDSMSRKNLDYLGKRLESLEAQWRDFAERHEVLTTELVDKNINYFTDDIYGKTKAMYESTKRDIMSLQLHFQQQREKEVKFDLSDLGELDEDKVKLMLNKQMCNFKAIDRALSKIDLKRISEKWEMEDHLSILKTKWEAIDRLHWELESSLKDSDESYHAMFLDIEHKYDEMRKNLNTKIWSNMHYQQSAPRIEVPEFSGNYIQWISFKDLFIETIHNNPTISNAQKMQHLKTKLKGEPERLVQHLHINSENYTSCWEILTQRYDNRRLQFTSYMNAICNVPVIQQPDAFNLKRIHDVITECLNGLTNIGVDNATWGPMIVHMMSQKLDSTTHAEYTKDLQDQREVPNLNDFLYFLESKFMAYETLKTPKKQQETTEKPKTPFSKNFNKKYQKFSNSKTYHARYGQCPQCNEAHSLMQCSKFVNMEPTQRIALVSKLNICKNCLFSHGEKVCSSKNVCKECKNKHHTLLHITKVRPSTGNGNNQSQNPSLSTQSLSSHHLSTNEMEVLLTTIQLRVKSNDGTYLTLRALLDQGSQVNLITENAAQLLRLPRKKLNATVSGIGTVSGDCKGRLQLDCKSIHSDYSFQTQALIMRRLTNKLPNSTFEKSAWPHLENLKLADPDFNISRPIDLLLGADVYSKILLDGVLRGQQQSPIAQQTHLGWILCGKLKTFNCYVTLANLNELTKFWENEDVIATHSNDTSTDDQCEDYYTKTVQRDTEGKYIVKMPMVPNFQNNLGKSKSIAISQFLQLEKRLEKNNKLARMYRDFVKEYTELNHMKLASPLSTSESECYLPHHGVLREQSTTTKLRVVFNASQKTSTGYSLNSLMEKGPNLQKDIQALILKWRSYKYAFTADIEKMYRCIRMADDQQTLQKIIWRDSPSERLQEFQLCTVTYGTKCAPWLAMRTLQQLALDDGHKYPTAANSLQNEFYVDDVISGHYSLEEAKSLQNSLINLLKGGGMNLRKWSANHPALLENLTEDQVSTKAIFDFKTDDSTKTLGLSWNPKSDTFMFNWNLDEKSKGRITKRKLLSDISKLYDPLGWMAPITVAAKLIFQRVWNCKLAWDDEPPSDILNEWIKLKTELQDVNKIKLNRWIGVQQSIELLGFCDASEKAYSCVIYSRAKNEENMPTITLLAAKTRVAPLSQKTTLPRLELCGALLLSKLMEKVVEAFSGYDLTIQAWSDSQVVLAWLQGDESRWDKYVSNRVHKIKLIIPSDKWRYVKSSQNPADCASRGMLPSKLSNFDLWWQGPGFLKEKGDSELETNPICFLTQHIERRNLEETTLATSTDNEHFIYKLLSECSSLTKVIRVTAQVLRFIATTRDKMQPDTTYLSANELKLATEQIIKQVQRTEFGPEYKQLMANETVMKRSSIYKLNPYLDEKGIVRVGGRLKNSNLPFEMKNPVILSRNGRLTQLVIEQAHLTTIHGGARLTLAQIRQRYWIISGNRAVKTQLRRCVRCHRFNPTDNYQLMADLPQPRATPSRPFTHTGVDFTGHVEVKLNKGRGVKTSKGYIAIFICMATKAVHIELVSDLSTETFIAAFQRMCARRGTPKHVYSDCGTNFIGASKMLRNEFEYFKQELSPEFFVEIGKLEVEWHFNAPAWPTAGGLWESAVKSMKHHLRRVLGDQKLTYEEFTTLLTKIEACLNSRPLCPLTEDPEEFQHYLTPGHFLTGSSTMSLPISNYCDVNNVDLRQRWQLTEHMLQRFWKNWSNEYLTQLQLRSKWNKPKRNLQEGDIVLVKDNNLPPGRWAMGRVMELHPGADGYVRVTTLKTQSGIIKRPIVKLSPLPIEKSAQDQLETETPGMPKKGTKKKCFVTFLTTLIILFTLATGSYGASVSSSAQITSFEADRPIYYDTMGNVQVIHDEWTLLMYYNLTNYWNGVRRIEAYLTGLSELCQKTDPRYCKTTLEQLSHEMDILSYYNTILLSPHKHLTSRKKRGLVDGIGYVANSLFGILDQRFADKYQNDIQNIQNNENYLLELVRNQTSIVELQNNVLKKNELNIKRQLSLIDGFMTQIDTKLAKVESAMEIVMATNYFNSASLTAYLLISNLERVQEMLFETLTDVYKGHIDVHLMTPVTLIEQLTEIAGKLPRTSSLPIRNIQQDVKDLYKLLYVRARVTTNYFLFEIHIPLISDEEFTLYQAIPLPMTTSTGTAIVQLASQYIAVNFRKNTYVSLSEEDTKQCIHLQPGNLICNKNLPIFNLYSSNAPCEAKLLGHRTTSPCDLKKTSCKDKWIALHTANTWLAICCGTCTIRTVCEHDITSYSMTSGILTLAQGCLLQTKELTIHSHNQYNSNMKMDYSIKVPALNAMVNKISSSHISSHNMPTSMLPENEELDDIDKRLAVIKTREEQLPSTLTSHDIHQYTISYTILGVVILVLAGWLVKRYGSSCRSQPTKTNQPEEIELQPIRRRRQEEITSTSQAEMSDRLRRKLPTADNIAFNFD